MKEVVKGVFFSEEALKKAKEDYAKPKKNLYGQSFIVKW